MIAGQGTRPGTAAPQDGGFLLSGSWSFASGIKHATHIHTLGLIEGTDEPRIFVLPVGKATLIDNWDVLGLRATGSIDYRIDNVFVPEAYTHFAAAQTPRRGGPLFNIAVIGFAVLCHSGWACGIGRRLLDELAAKVRGGRRPHRHAGRERDVPRAVRQGRGQLPRGARARLRDVGRAWPTRSTAASG